jgi:antirestriction protein ArdC
MTTEIEAGSLDRARNGQTMTNYPAIFAGFIEKGIAEHDIRPRENVFTFHAWKALGRSVKKGEHGVKVVTFIERSVTERDPATGEQVDRAIRSPHTTTVFHISQTVPTAEREARHGRFGRSHGTSQAHDRDPGYVDPGELVADRWNETHY